MEKKYKNGLCLGKFMPIHEGHVYMIREAQKQCETVHVMICSRLCEPIEGVMRKYWADHIFKDDADIIIHLCEDENPQYPEDDKNFWQIWYDSVYSYIDELDAVFGSEDYIPKFAKQLGIEPVTVDIDRETFPVSGTDVRRDPHHNWAHIPDIVKPYYKTKVAIVGPESTGKSTLVKELGEHFEGDMISEFGREYTETKVPAEDLTPEDFLAIMQMQWTNIKKAKASTNKFLFSDTEAIITKTFGIMYGIEMNEQFLATFDNMIRSQVREFDFYILCYPDIQWDNDGTRDFGKQADRLAHFGMIKDHLDVYNANYITLSGKDYQRTANALMIVNKMKSINWEQYWEKLSFERVDNE